MNTDDLYRKRLATPVFTRDDLYRKQPAAPKEPREQIESHLKASERLYWKIEDVSRKMVGIQCDLAEIGQDFDDFWEMAGEEGRENSLVPKAVVSTNDNYIHISTNFCPPKFGVYPSRSRNCKHATTYQDVRSIWHVAIFDALQKAPPIPMTKKALVLLAYRRKTEMFDPPNLDSKVVLDALVDLGLLFDDSRDYLTLVIGGKYSDEEGTDIYIGKWENLLSLVPGLLELDRP